MRSVICGYDEAYFDHANHLLVVEIAALYLDSTFLFDSLLAPSYSKLKACPYKHVPLICGADVREGRKVP